MSLRDELLSMRRTELMGRLVGGHAIDVDQIADWEYRGISLGLPGFVDRLAWKTFSKIFHRDPALGVVRGWNVRLEQTGIEGPIKPITRGGEPVAFGHYRVESLASYVMPYPVRRGLMLDYGRGGNPGLDPTRFLRDPVVALEEGSVERLLGWSYVDLAGFRMGTPSFFLLERLRPLERVVPAPGGTDLS